MDKKPEKLVPEVRFKGFTDDWEQHKLEEVVSVFDGTHQTPNYKTKGIMFLSVENINTLLSNKYISENEYRQRFKIKPQYLDVFMTRIGTIGKTNVITTHKPIAYYVSLALLRPQNIQSFFLSFIIQTSKVQQDIWKRTLQIAFPQKINKDEIGKVTLALPLQKEQIDIEKLLLKLDKLITLQQRKLEFLKEIKKGLLQKMFADKSKFPILRFEGFHNEWEQRKLKNVYQKIGNAFVGTASPYYVDAGHFYLESNNIKNGQINRNHEVFINNSFYQKQSNKLLHTGDLVMVQSGHVGDTAVITQEYNNSAAHALIMFRNPKDKFLSDYLNFYFQNTSAKNKINVLAIGNTIRHVLASDMSRFSVYFPNKDERKYISNLLLKLQYTITLQQSKISQLTILKKYLLQKLFI